MALQGKEGTYGRLQEAHEKGDAKIVSAHDLCLRSSSCIAPQRDSPATTIVDDRLCECRDQDPRDAGAL